MAAIARPVDLIEPRVTPAAGYVPFFSLGNVATIHERFEEIAQRYPGNPALTSAGEVWAYERLNRAANQVAWRLMAAGLQIGERVALIGRHRPESVAAHLGISKAGGVVVPLDPASSHEALVEFLASCSPKFIGTERRFARTANEVAAATSSMVLTLGEESGEPEHDPAVQISPTNPYVIIYSSGSTGVPKRVVLTHQQRFLQSGHFADALGIGNGDRWSFLHHLHSAGSLAEFVSALHTGATLATYDVSERGLSGMSNWIREQRLTVLHWIPSGYRRFLDTLQPGETISGLRILLLGSEPAHSSDLAGFQRHFAPPCRFVNRFAAAEAGCPCLYVADSETRVPGGVLPAG